MVKVPGVRTPRPAAHFHARCAAYVLKLAVSETSIERIAAGVLTIERADILRLSFVKALVLGNADTRGRPHGRGVEIWPSVVVEITPRSAHSRADVLHAGFGGDAGKCSVAIVAIKIVSTEIVSHIKVGKAVRVVVAPSASKAVTVVVDVQPGGLRAVNKSRIAGVVKEKIGRTIARIEIRSGIVILV